ncbi:SpoIIE family protein phosphatase [Chloroflexota bacterium]
MKPGRLRLWSRFSLTTKILVVFLALLVVSLAVVGTLALVSLQDMGDHALHSQESLGEQAVHDSTQALEDQAEEYLLRLSKNKAAISNTLFEEIEAGINTGGDYASQLWSNPVPSTVPYSYSAEEKPDDIYSASVYYTSPDVTPGSVADDIDLTSCMDEIFIPVLGNNSYLLWIYMGTESGVFRVYPWMDALLYEPDFNHKIRPWYQRAKNTGEAGWTELYVDAGTLDLAVTYSSPIYDDSGEFIGVIAADVTLKTINESIINTHAGESGYAFLADVKGDIVASPGLSAEDKGWDESFNTENLLESDNQELRAIALEMITAKTGVARATFEEGERYVAYTPVLSTGWSIGIVMPLDEIVAPARATGEEITIATDEARSGISDRIGRTRNIFIFIFIGLALAVIVLASWLARTISRPVLALSAGVKMIGAGQLDHQVHVRTGDEIEELAESFNKMTSDLKAYIRDLKDTTAAKERIESELRIATEIQISMLPRIFPPYPDRKEFDVYATMSPAKEVGGDFYDFFLVTENKFCFIIGDVCGKGVPAALFMAISKTLLKMEALAGYTPAEVLERVNNTLYPDNDSSMFFTGLCAILDTDTGELCIANGGHNPPLLRSNSNEFQFVELPRGIPVGPMPDIKYQSTCLTMSPGSVLFLYTDGVTEATNIKDELFSEARLQQSLLRLTDNNPVKLLDGAIMDIEAFVDGAEQSDDITIMVLRFNGKEPNSGQ